MKATVRIDEEGKVRIPGNLARAAGVEEGGWLVIRLGGGAQAPYLLIKNRKRGKRAGRPVRRR